MAPGGLSWTTAGKAPAVKTPLHVFQTAANATGLFLRDGSGAPLPTGPGVYFPDSHGRVAGRTLQANQCTAETGVLLGWHLSCGLMREALIGAL